MNPWIPPHSHRCLEMEDRGLHRHASVCFSPSWPSSPVYVIRGRKLKGQPWVSRCHWTTGWSTTQLKRSGAATHPCLTPLLMLNHSESFPFMRTQLWESPLSFLNSLRILPGTPMHARIAHNEAWSTESNAAFRSMKARYKCRPLRNSRVFSMMRRREDIWSIVERFGRKPTCCGRL